MSDAVEATPPPLPERPLGEGGPVLPRSTPTPSGVARHWLRRIRRGIAITPSDPDSPEFAPASEPQPQSLLTRSPFQIGFFLALGAIAAYGLVTAVVSLKDVVVLVLLALFLSLGLNPLVDGLHNRGVPRAGAVLLVALTMLVVLVLGAWAVLPVGTEQVNKLLTNAPSYLQGLRDNPQIAEFDRQYGVINRAIEFLGSGTWLSALFGGILGASRVVGYLVFSLIITVVLTIYFLASLPSIKNVIYQLAPASRRPRVRYLANEMFRRIGNYMSGMFVVVTLWGVGSFIVLNVVGLGQFSLALSIVVAVFAFIPIVGSSVGLILCTLVAGAQSLTTGVIVLAYFLVYQQLDAYLVQPRVFSQSMNVPAVLVILGATSGGFLLGIPGALLAIPTVASLLLLYREVLVPHLDRS